MGEALEISDALVSLLQSTLGSRNVSNRTYGILGRRKNWAAIVELRACDVVKHQLHSFARHWTFRVAIYINDSGDPGRTMTNILSATDLALEALLGDPTIGGTVNQIEEIEVSRNPGESLELSGRLWIPVYLDITAVKF